LRRRKVGGELDPKGQDPKVRHDAEVYRTYIRLF